MNAVKPPPASAPTLRDVSENDPLVSSPVLSPMERRRIRLIRKSFESAPVDAAIRFCQRTVGQQWMHLGIGNLRHVYGLDRLPKFDPKKSYVCVSNHRSFFDMYAITSYLVHEGLIPHRLMFPVRSTFFYDAPLGLLVNGVMSFFAMYPPLFRDREKAALNIASIDEAARLMAKGGMFIGLHPEGTRKLDDDPYTFLRAHTGVGRIMHQTKAEVIPCFVNGLRNDLPKLLIDNATRRGRPINIVFGKPIDFGDLVDAPPSPRVFKAMSERSMEVVGELGQEEREIRAKQNQK